VTDDRVEVVPFSAILIAPRNNCLVFKVIPDASYGLRAAPGTTLCS